MLIPRALSIAAVALPLSLALHAQVTAPDPPAEEKYKNIQVFKGEPSSRILPAMFFMRGALGISCNHCHVNFRDFEKDDNPNKDVARKMIRMVRSLNQSDFGGQLTITCNTCHRGQPKPVAPLAFAAIGNGKPTAAAPAQAASTTVPGVDEIFERYVAATGRSAVTSLELKGSMLTSEGWTAPLTIGTKSGGKVFITNDVPGWPAPAVQASNGNIGWSQDNHGLHDLAGKRLSLLQRQTTFFQPQRLKSQYLKLTSIGKEVVGGREAYAVRGELPENESETLYFDTQSGLLFRITTRTDSPLGVLPNEVDVEDYRDIGGVKVPFMIVHQAPDFSSAYKIEKGTLNPAIDDARFEKPAPPAQ
jgi:hypothetical protein